MMRHRSWRLALALPACALGQIDAAQAQEIKVDVAPTIRVQYDSNTLRLNDLRGDGPRDNIRVTPGVALRLSHDFGIGPVFVAGDIGYDKNTRFDFLDRSRINIRTGGSVPLGAFCTISPDVGFEYAQTDIDDLVVSDGNATTLQRYEADISCRRRLGFSPGISGGHVVRQYSDISRERANSIVDRVTATINYNKPSLGLIEVYGGISRVRRPNFFVTGSTDDESTTRRFGVNISRAVSSIIQANAGVNTIEVRTNRPGVSSFDSIGWNAQVRVSPAPRLAFTASTNRDAGGDDGFGTAFTIRRSYTVGAAYTVSARTQVNVSLAQFNRIFRGEDLAVIPLLRSRERVRVASVDIGYRLNRRLRLGADARYRTRSSDNPLFDYNATSFGVSLGGNF